MPPTFILSQDQTLQLVICINDQLPARERAGAIVKEPFEAFEAEPIAEANGRPYDLVLALKTSDYKEPRS